MKRILNLNDFSIPALKAILITGLVIPAVLFLSSRLLAYVGVQLRVLEQAARILLVMGGFLLLLFFVLVVIEQIQDHLLYKSYLRKRGQQVEGECPFCGNRQVRAFDYSCRVCGEKIPPKD